MAMGYVINQTNVPTFYFEMKISGLYYTLKWSNIRSIWNKHVPFATFSNLLETKLINLAVEDNSIQMLSKGKITDVLKSKMHLA